MAQIVIGTAGHIDHGETVGEREPDIAKRGSGKTDQNDRFASNTVGESTP